jgi:hypothetical protein
MASQESQTVQGSIYFLSRNSLYNTVKPYTLRYRPTDSLPQTNVERNLHTIQIHDMRHEPNLVYEECGFCVVELNSVMSYDDYDDAEKVESMHQKEVGDAVKRALGAKCVDVVDFVVRISWQPGSSLLYLQIRRRDPNWPFATGETYGSQQPASAAHIGK